MNLCSLAWASERRVCGDDPNGQQADFDMKFTYRLSDFGYWCESKKSDTFRSENLGMRQYQNVRRSIGDENCRCHDSHR
jgi:hypothetical protein